MRGCAVGFLGWVLLACASTPEPQAPEEPPPSAVGEEAAVTGDGDGSATEGASGGESAGAVGAANITHHVARTVDDVDSTAPAAGKYRVHLIDVGTGLAVLIQGHDFNLLFGGGSGDDSRGISATENSSRLLAYLWEAVGPSGPKGCQPGRVSLDPGPDPELTIQTVVLSHPHDDHAAMLDEVLRCYNVEQVYDSGAINNAFFYGDFIAAVAREPEVTYHTALAPPANKKVTVKGAAHTIAGPWVQFSEGIAESNRIALGEEASFRILHANGERHSDPNLNSIVLRVDLGATSLLLTGDAESGDRKPPSAELGDVEKHLVDDYAQVINVDILQVGHHGSETSSRLTFLNAVSPQWALIGVGPKKYKTVTLPDDSVAQAVTEVVGDASRVFLTDDSDAMGCLASDRIGVDDARPGGCDNHILEIAKACCRICATGPSLRQLVHWGRRDVC